jgi:hypothetical protein
MSLLWLIFAILNYMNDVETFIEHLSKKWQKQKCKELLAIQHKANGDLEAAIKWGNPYFSYQGKALLKWYCANNWINVYFFRGKDLNDKTGLFTETENVKMCTVKIFEDTEINDEGYLNLVKQAAALSK